MSPAKARRHATKKIARKAGVEIHVSHLVVLPEMEEYQRDYVEIREYDTNAEIYGHGILVPWDAFPEVMEALNSLFAVNA